MATPLQTLKAVGQMVFGETRVSALFSLSGEQVDYKQAVGDGTTSNVVVICINWLQRNFTQASLRAYQEGDDASLELISAHPLIALIRRPNSDYGPRELWKSTVLSLMIDGNAYWQKIRDRTGTPVELWSLPTHEISPARSSPRDFISHYVRTLDGKKTRIPKEDIIHFRNGIDPKAPMLGISPLTTLFREIYTDEEAAAYTATLMRNKGVIGAVISPKGADAMPEKDFQAAKQYFTSQFSGGHRGKPLVTRAETVVQNLGYNPAELDLSDIRNIPEERITATYGIHAAILGLGTGKQRTAGRATLQELRREAWVGTIIPLQDELIEHLSIQLLPDFEDEGDVDKAILDFDRAKVTDLREGPAERAEVSATLFRAGITTRADARRANNYPVTPADEVYFVPTNVIEVPVGQPLPSPDDGDDDDDDDDDSSQRAARKASSQNVRLIRAFARDARRLQRDFADTLDTHLRELGARASEAYLLLAPPEPSGFAAAKQLSPEDEILAAAVFDETRVPDWTSDRMSPAFQGHYTRTLSTTVGTVNAVAQLGVDLPDHRQREVLARGGRRLGLIDFQGQTRDGLFRSLHDARSRGLSNPATARLIRDQVPAGRFANSRTRANLIARTEAKYAQNVSSLTAYRESPNILGVIAFDAQGGRSDSECQQRDQRIYPIEEADIISAAEHPNGTLSWAPSRHPPETHELQPIYDHALPSEEALDDAIDRITQTANTTGQDTWLKNFAEARWGRQQAQVVDGDVFDALDGEVIVRSVSKAEQTAAQIDGTFFGQGTLMNGQYYGHGPTRYYDSVAFGSIDSGGWMHAAKLRPDAKVVRWSEVVEELGRELGRVPSSLRNFNSNGGRLASRRGYDVVVNDIPDFQAEVVVLNRRALVVDRRSLPNEDFYNRLRAVDSDALNEQAAQLTNRASEVLINEGPAAAVRLLREAEGLRAQTGRSKQELLKEIMDEAYPTGQEIRANVRFGD